MIRQEYNKLNELIAENDKIIDKELFKKYFEYDILSDIQADLYKKRDISSNETKANLSKNKLDSFLKNVINNITMSECNTEKPYKIVHTVLRILRLNKKYQEGQGLKILTPQQMLSRLPISLAQLKAGNNAEKLKNEIRQLLYYLYRSKKLSKTIYKHLMNTII